MSHAPSRTPPSKVHGIPGPEFMGIAAIRALTQLLMLTMFSATGWLEGGRGTHALINCKVLMRVPESTLTGVAGAEPGGMEPLRAKTDMFIKKAFGTAWALAGWLTGAGGGDMMACACCCCACC